MLTYRVLSHIPDFVPLGGMVLGGIWWITHRREEVALAEGWEPSDEGAASKFTETNPAKKNGRKP
jgi:formate dehydrogenase iron-sulfur subunit